MNKWIYLKKEINSINDFDKDVMGFVYKVTHIPSGKSYIGKKFLVHTQKRKLAKKDLKIYEGTPGRKPKYKIVSKESDWKTYYGSNKQLCMEVLENPDEYFNDNILGKFFTRDFGSVN